MKFKLPDKGLKIMALSPKYHKTHLDPNIIFSYKKDKNKKIKITEAFEDNFEGRVKVYEDRIKGWFFEFGKKLSKQNHSGFIILMICVAYLEGNQQLREGKESKGKSGEMIKKAILRMMKIPKKNEELLDLFIKEVRCGLFHDGMTRKHILIKDDLEYPFIIDEENEILIISPSQFLELVDIDLELYIRDLGDKNNIVLRKNFETFWKFRYD